ncbi:GNAT family N-acetyltransferase [Pontibacter cellulosilyticus]|uniref:GNAT family N-acetyltransferase n=1 Tax=Pontibacter cellulosilyticus TaxID=1720253 RepID=A0A923NCN8_9BACT|nr:GNAT family protein [Pontibacter cellulosilyticus]MBC5994967.1 GNAT family N-acetyltransferase [Pontibacter cellulosilyticus]
MHPTLTTKRLQLRLIQPADASFILQGLSDERVTKYYAVHYDTLEEVQEQMEFYENLIAESTGVWWAFSLQGSDELIGACGFSSVEEGHLKAEIGFWILPAYWGKGYIAEAAKAIIEYGFNEMHLNRIEAIVEGGNVQSESVLKKLGFEFEGRLREREVKNDQFIDLLYYSILREKSETNAQRKAFAPKSA